MEAYQECSCQGLLQTKPANDEMPRIVATAGAACAWACDPAHPDVAMESTPSDLFRTHTRSDAPISGQKLQ